MNTIKLFFITLTLSFNLVQARKVSIDKNLINGWEDPSARWLNVPEFGAQWVYVGILDHDELWIDTTTGACNFIYIDPFVIYNIFKADWFSELINTRATIPKNIQQLKLPIGLYFWRNDGAGRTWQPLKGYPFQETLNSNVNCEASCVRHSPGGKIFSYATNGLNKDNYINIFALPTGTDIVWDETRHTQHPSPSWYGTKPHPKHHD